MKTFPIMDSPNINPQIEVIIGELTIEDKYAGMLRRGLLDFNMSYVVDFTSQKELISIYLVPNIGEPNIMDWIKNELKYEKEQTTQFNKGYFHALKKIQKRWEK